MNYEWKESRRFNSIENSKNETRVVALESLELVLFLTAREQSLSDEQRRRRLEERGRYGQEKGDKKIGNHSDKTHIKRNNLLIRLSAKFLFKRSQKI